MTKAITWAEQFEGISDDEKEILIQSKQSLLYTSDSHWSKKGGSNFDNAMGSYDGAECCDLVGLYMLSELYRQGLNVDLGLYRDDGLAVSGGTPQQVERIKKDICATFNENGLNVTVSANLKVVQFLDVEFNLSEESFKPYLKPNQNPLYVNINSNHPHSVTKNIPVAVNRRLCALSSDEKMFKSVAPIYQAALNNAGYKHTLVYTPVVVNEKKKKKNN